MGPGNSVENLVANDFVAGALAGGVLGGWVGYRFGLFTAALRAARSTYKTQRRLHRR
jgi:membrane protein YqaA with SNARE-associated domain